MLKHCSLRTSSVFPSKLKLNTDPEAEPYRIHHPPMMLRIQNGNKLGGGGGGAGIPLKGLRSLKFKCSYMYSSFSLEHVNVQFM